MSAWDIAGAVLGLCALTYAVWFCRAFFHAFDEPPFGHVGLGVLSAGLAVFCIARLCGAH